METITGFIGRVLLILTVTVVLALILTSKDFEESYYGILSNATNDTWNTYTLNGGVDRYEAYSNMLDSFNGDTYEATGD